MRTAGRNGEEGRRKKGNGRAGKRRREANEIGEESGTETENDRGGRGGRERGGLNRGERKREVGKTGAREKLLSTSQVVIRPRFVST